ncbi:MAG: ChbG/HpnK family deacetylase [Paenibacillus sp.]|jgi:hypothetical protein|nr:ChbG/HpnK family deacetylase [Paenibacillus sp.]
MAETFWTLCLIYAENMHYPSACQFEYWSIRILAANKNNCFKKEYNRLIGGGIRLIDDMAGLAYPLAAGEDYRKAKHDLMQQIRNLKPGITQMVTHPAIVSDELKELTEHYEKRMIEIRLFNDPEIKELFKTENIKCISWKTIRDLQRSMNS